MVKEMDNIFVYGTLMRGKSAHKYLAKARFLGSGSLRNYALYRISWFPGIRPKEGYEVLGEVYEIMTEDLPAMDAYEGEGELYHRRKVTIVMEDGSMKKAWAYIYAYMAVSAPLSGKWGDL